MRKRPAPPADTIAMIFPAHEDPPQLFRAIASLRAATPEDRYRVVVVANDRVTIRASAIWRRQNPDAWVVNRPDNPGHLGGVNAALDALPWIERFCFLAKDVSFGGGWLEAADAVWRAHFDASGGLVAFNDGIQDGLIAAHGMTSRAWLRVVFENGRFPSHDYFHYFMDSEFSVRSRDLERYQYAETAHVRHDWVDHALPADKFTLPDGRPINDQDARDRRHWLWVGGELAAARSRLLGTG